MKYQLGDKKVRCLGKCFIAPSAAVIGDVELGHNTSVWFSAVVRADNDSIIIGDGSNIQECAVLHVDPGIPLTIGQNVTVGHKAMLHGCSIDDGSLIGMNAVVLNGAKIGKNCLIGANALVTENSVIPDNSLVLGSPGKVVKTLNEDAAKQMQLGAQIYQDKIPLFLEELKEQLD